MLGSKETESNCIIPDSAYDVDFSQGLVSTFGLRALACATTPTPQLLGRLRRLREEDWDLKMGLCKIGSSYFFQKKKSIVFIVCVW